MKYGANPSVPSSDERLTALHEAVTSEDIDMITVLVAHGADRDIKDSLGISPRHLAEDKSEDGGDNLYYRAEITSVLTDDKVMQALRW